MIPILTPQTLSDEELVSEIVATNSSHLFAVLYDRFSQFVYYKCYKFTNSKQEAEDLTHDVFVRLFDKLQTFKGHSKFSTWLYSFTYNFCVNYVKRNDYKKKQRLTIVSDNVKDTIDESNFDGKDTAILASDKLYKVLEKINAKEKSILLMKYQEEMSIREIQKALNIGESAVKMRIKRAKQKVVDMYAVL